MNCNITNIDLKIGKQEKDCLFVAFNYITHEALHMTWSNKDTVIMKPIDNTVYLFGFFRILTFIQQEWNK